jgi:hypothetical protein
MKRRLLLTGIFTILILTTATVGYAYMADYSLPWWTVDAGGGTSNSAQYALSGTIGQADAGSMTGGDYSLAGGFWVGSWQAERQFYLPLITR